LKHEAADEAKWASGQAGARFRFAGDFLQAPALTHAARGDFIMEGADTAQ